MRYTPTAIANIVINRSAGEIICGILKSVGNNYKINNQKKTYIVVVAIEVVMRATDVDVV